MPLIHVADPHDTRLDDYRNVPDPDLLVTRGIFIAEGRLVVRRLLESSRFATRSVLVNQAALESLGPIVDGRPELRVFVVPQGVINAITGFNIHRGCLAVGERTASCKWQDVAAGARTLVLLERVANADNVGSIFRNAAAFGAGAVLLGPACADPLYRKAIRTSMGAALSLPFAPATPWPNALGGLREQGWTLVALTPAPDAAPLCDVATRLRGRRVALLLGHEGEGLTADAMSHCDTQARIPITDGVDSLNVATAAAVALYELNR